MFYFSTAQTGQILQTDWQTSASYNGPFSGFFNAIYHAYHTGPERRAQRRRFGFQITLLDLIKNPVAWHFDLFDDCIELGTLMSETLVYCREQLSLSSRLALLTFFRNYMNTAVQSAHDTLLPGANYWDELTSAEQTQITRGWAFNFALAALSAAFVQIMHQARVALASGASQWIVLGFRVRPGILQVSFAALAGIQFFRPAIIRRLTHPVVERLSATRQDALLTNFTRLSTLDPSHTQAQSFIRRHGGSRMIRPQMQLLESSLQVNQSHFVTIGTTLLFSLTSGDLTRFGLSVLSIVVASFIQSLKNYQEILQRRCALADEHDNAVQSITDPSSVLRTYNRQSLGIHGVQATRLGFFRAEESVHEVMSHDYLTSVTTSVRLLINALATYCDIGSVQWATRLDEMITLLSSVTALSRRAEADRLSRATASRVDQLTRQLRTNQTLSEHEGLVPNDSSITLLDIQMDVPDRNNPGMQKTLFQNVAFHAKPGQLIVIHGNNGIGKTTLLNVICGAHSATCGAVKIGGVDIRELSQARMNQWISYFPSIIKFQENESVIFNLLCTLSDVPDAVLIQLTGEDAETIWCYAPSEDEMDLEDYREILGRCNRTLTAFGMGHFKMSNDTANLSDGEKKRLLFAITHMRNTPIMVFDEATGGLDGNARDFAKYITSQKDKTRIIVTHHPEYYPEGSHYSLFSDGLRPSDCDEGETPPEMHSHVFRH